MTEVKQMENPHDEHNPILHMAVSPDGESIATLAADENLKFWKWWGKEGGRLKNARRRRSTGEDHTTGNHTGKCSNATSNIPSTNNYQDEDVTISSDLFKGLCGLSIR